MVRARPAALCLVAIAAISCSSQQAETQPEDYRTFQAAQRHEAAAFATAQTLEEFEGGAPRIYTMGPGDQITVTVWTHEDPSGKHIIGPDGRISLPIVGSQELTD